MADHEIRRMMLRMLMVGCLEEMFNSQSVGQIKSVTVYVQSGKRSQNVQ